MTATTVTIKPRTPLYPLDGHGLAQYDRAMTRDYVAENVPVVGQYAGHVIVRFDDGEEYAATLRSLGHLQATMLGDDRPSPFLPLDLLEAEAEALVALLDASGTHSEPSNTPDAFGIIATDFMPEIR